MAPIVPNPAETGSPAVATHTSLRGDIVFAFAVLILLYVAWQVRSVLLLVYVSALFAVVLSPALDMIQNVRIATYAPTPALSIFILAGIFLTFTGIFAVFILPPILTDLGALAHDWPNRTAALTLRIRSLPFLENFQLPRLDRYGAEIATDALTWFSDLAGGLLRFATAAILTGYFILDGRRALWWLLSLFPRRQHVRLHATFMRAELRIRHWLVGQFALMLMLGVTSGIVFASLHMKYFFALALFAGATNLVPVLGALASLTLASSVALMDSWQKMAAVIAFYVIYFQIENAFLIPRIMKSTLDLPPLAVIISLLLGGELAGILGALIAVPTAGLVAVFIDEYIAEEPS